MVLKSSFGFVVGLLHVLFLVFLKLFFQDNVRSLTKREKVDGAYRVLDLRSPLLYYFPYTPTFGSVRSEKAISFFLFLFPKFFLFDHLEFRVHFPPLKHRFLVETIPSRSFIKETGKYTSFRDKSPNQAKRELKILLFRDLLFIISSR